VDFNTDDFAEEYVVIAGADGAVNFAFHGGQNTGEQGDAGFAGDPFEGGETVMAFTREVIG
jgi:hypothetical protein